MIIFWAIYFYEDLIFFPLMTKNEVVREGMKYPADSNF